MYSPNVPLKNNDNISLRARSLIHALFKLDDSKQSNLAYNLMWLTLPLDIMLFYLLSDLQRAPFFLLNLMAAKLIFVITTAWVGGKLQKLWNADKILPSLDLAVGIIWVWLLCNILMMTTVIITKMRTEQEGGVPEPIITWLSTKEMPSIPTWLGDGEIYGEPIAFFLYSFIGVFFAKIIAFYINNKTYKLLSGMSFWVTCCFLVGIMQGSTFFYYMTL